MLPRPARLTRSDGFSAAVRGGRRAGSRLLVVHLARDSADGQSPQVGFVVSKAVGPAVVRNRVKRRLRHLVREHLDALPATSLLVVRAQPASAQATYAELGRALERGIARASDHEERAADSPGLSAPR